LSATLGQLFDSTARQYVLSADIDLRGRLPARWRDSLGDSGWNVETAGDIAIAGKVAGQWDGSTWVLRGQPLSVHLAPGDVTLPGQAGTLRGLTGDVPVSLAANRDGISIHVQPGSTLA